MGIHAKGWLIRCGVATLYLFVIGFCAWVLATPPSPGKIFGLYSIRAFTLFLVVSYILSWAWYFALSREATPKKIGKCALTTATLFVLFGLLELPVVLGVVDYWFLIQPEGREYHVNLRNPRNRLDKELLWIHRPEQRIVGETFGDLVYALGVPPDRRYPINVKYDSRGFRNDHEIKYAPIVLIGDSFLDWPIIPNEGMVSTYLSRLLQLEVANLAQSGYGPQQELVVLRRYGLPLHPKLVL